MGKMYPDSQKHMNGLANNGDGGHKGSKAVRIRSP